MRRVLQNLIIAFYSYLFVLQACFYIENQKCGSKWTVYK